MTQSISSSRGSSSSFAAWTSSFCGRGLKTAAAITASTDFTDLSTHTGSLALQNQVTNCGISGTKTATIIQQKLPDLTLVYDKETFTITIIDPPEGLTLAALTSKLYSRDDAGTSPEYRSWFPMVILPSSGLAIELVSNPFRLLQLTPKEVFTGDGKNEAPGLNFETADYAPHLTELLNNSHTPSSSSGASDVLEPNKFPARKQLEEELKAVLSPYIQEKLMPKLLDCFADQKLHVLGVQMQVELLFNDFFDEHGRQASVISMTMPSGLKDKVTECLMKYGNNDL